MLRTLNKNTLAAWDEELFDELFVERRFFGRPLIVLNDPAGIRRVLRENYDNYPRVMALQRYFEFDSGTGMFHVEGDIWRRHRRLVNPTLDRAP